MTAAAVVTEDLELIYPGNQELGHDGAAGPWPVDRAGRDLSVYRNNAFGSDRSSHVVGEYNNFMGGYYHKSEFGFGHWSLYDEMPGRKLWLWSQSGAGHLGRSSRRLERTIHGIPGRPDIQPIQSFPYIENPITQVPFNPGLMTMKEISFPVKAIGGFVDVSPLGVMNVSQTNGKFRLALMPWQLLQAKVIVNPKTRLFISRTEI